EHAGPEVAGRQGRQDADGDRPAAERRHGPGDGGERVGELRGERSERPPGESHRTRIDLEVESIDLQRDARVERVREDGPIDRQRSTAGVDEAQLQLGAQGGRPSAEVRARKEERQRVEALLETRGEPRVVRVRELLTRDLQAHGRDVPVGSRPVIAKRRTRVTLRSPPPTSTPEGPW